MTPPAVCVVYGQAKGFRHSGRGIRKLDLVVGCSCRLECPVCTNGTGVVGEGYGLEWGVGTGVRGRDWSVWGTGVGGRDWSGWGTGVRGRDWSEG